MDTETLHMISVKLNRDDCIELLADRPMFRTSLRLSLGVRMKFVAIETLLMTFVVHDFCYLVLNP
jgi:hypothetical protein